MSSDTPKETRNSEGFPLAAHKQSKLKSIEAGHWDWPSEDMDISRVLRTRPRYSSSLLSEESTLDRDVSFFSGNHNRQARVDSPPMQALASGAQHSESSAAYFQWPPSSRLQGTAEERVVYFNGLQKELVSGAEATGPSGPQATTLLDLMTIRAYHSKTLRQFSLGTAIGFRTKRGVPTNIPAIIVFVARKLHKEWLPECQRLPPTLEGPGGVWCDVDVVEFSYYGASAAAPKEQVYTELVEGLRGNDPCIGPGSQVASQETYGTLGAIVQSRSGFQQVGFLTNRHVAVDLDYPNQKMFHPLPPNLGPGVYLGAVERATSFITDEIWYGIFASKNPETFVRADGAFIPFADSFDISRVTTMVKGVGDMGDVMIVDLQDPIGSIVGQQVLKVGRSSGLTKGSIMAYALEYNDEKGICFFTDFLIVGENQQAFDLEGDSGSLVLMTREEGEKPRPVGIIWGGTSNRGRLKLRNGDGPENWTSGVNLGRLLELLQLDLITSDMALAEAVEEQRRWTAGLAVGSMVGESSPRPWGMVDKGRVGFGWIPSFDLQTQFEQEGEANQSAGFGEISNFDADSRPQHQIEEEEKPGAVVMNNDLLFDLVEPASASAPLVELEFIKESDFKFASESRGRETEQDQCTVKDSDNEELSFGLSLFRREPKRRRTSTDN